MKSAAAVFLGGAASRLLPASVPFRFFGAAVVYHALAWLTLLAAAPEWPRFAGGLGRPLAALHLVTLGVLAMAAIGASLQLLPVATRQPVASERAPALIWWLFAPAVAVLAIGMAFAVPALLAVGAIAIVVALLLFAVLLAANLRAARGMPGVVAHGWAALVSLLVALATALALVGNYVGLPSLARTTALALHVAFAGYGFMGLLAAGVSAILVPMFTLASLPDTRVQLVSCAFAVAGLGLAGAAAAGVAPTPTRVAALACGAIAVALHLMLMRRAIRDGMQRELGRSFMLVRVAWASLVASVAAALGVVLDVALPALTTVFGLLLIGGWLLTLVLAMLQRILPFLASMHGARAGRRAPVPSSFTATTPLAIHFACHLAALAGLVVAAVGESAAIATIAAATGTLGAAAFAVYYVVLVRRMAAPRSVRPRAAIAASR
nr:hypothetical protein [Caldimonas sp.]